MCGGGTFYAYSCKLDVIEKSLLLFVGRRVTRTDARKVTGVKNPRKYHRFRTKGGLGGLLVQLLSFSCKETEALNGEMISLRSHR